MSKADKLFEMLADIPRQIVDQSSFTQKEMREQRKDLTRHQIKSLCAAKVASGQFEKVFKRVGGILIPAYRMARLQKQP